MEIIKTQPKPCMQKWNSLPHNNGQILLTGSTLNTLQILKDPTLITIISIKPLLLFPQGN